MKMPRIKRKCDWVIAGIFAFLIIYAVISGFQCQIKIPVNRKLLAITPDKISYANQPEWQAGLGISIVLFLALLEAVLLVKKTGRKKILLSLCFGFAAIALIFVSYYAECQLIVSSTKNLKPSDVYVSAVGEGGKQSDFLLSDKQKEELTKKIRALKTDTGKKTSDFGVDSTKNPDYEIIIRYPRKFHHSYLIWLHIYGDVLVQYKTGDCEEEPVMKDNGVLEMVKGISALRN